MVTQWELGTILAGGRRLPTLGTILVSRIIEMPKRLSKEYGSVANPTRTWGNKRADTSIIQQVKF